MSKSTGWDIFPDVGGCSLKDVPPAGFVIVLLLFAVVYRSRAYLGASVVGVGVVVGVVVVVGTFMNESTHIEECEHPGIFTGDTSY